MLFVSSTFNRIKDSTPIPHPFLPLYPGPKLSSLGTLFINSSLFLSYDRYNFFIFDSLILPHTIRDHFNIFVCLLLWPLNLFFIGNSAGLYFALTKPLFGLTPACYQFFCWFIRHESACAWAHFDQSLLPFDGEGLRNFCQTAAY